MMNVFAVSLILITLGTSGIICPNPDKTQHMSSAKEEQRAVVVEFEKDENGRTTKVSVSPQSGLEKRHVSNLKDKLSEKAEEVRQRFRDAASVLPNVGQGISGPENQQDYSGMIPGTLVGKAKEAVAEKSHKAMLREEEVRKRAKQATLEVFPYFKDTMGKVSEKAREAGKEILRRGGEASEYILSPENLKSLFGMAHLVGLAIAYGMCVWVTFMSSYVLAMALPRHKFSVVQTEIYTAYFKAMAYSIGTAFLGHFLSQRRWPYSNAAEAYLGFNLLAPLLLVFLNLHYLEPRATKVMFERMKMEKEVGRGMNAEGSSERGRAEVGGACEIIRLSERLTKLNSQSSFANVLTLMALSLHLAHLGQRLHTLS